MDDLELLAMAAKAAGYEIEWVRNSGCYYRCEKDASREQWDALDDDGDAFRLALKLQIKIEYVPEMDSVICSLPGSQGGTAVAAIGDIELRHCIVRAAAQLGLTL